MDPLTHACAGLTLAAAAGLDTPAALTLAAAATLPDLDGVAALWGGRVAYCRHHRAATHSLVGLPVQALLVGAVAAGVSELSLGVAVTLAALGLTLHVAMDWITPYGVRLLFPWRRRFC